MPGQPFKLGPFSGGINSFADASVINDNEMVDCVNLELTPNLELTSRPPIKTTTDMSGTWSERIVILGTGVFSNVTYIFGGNSDGTFQYVAGAWSQLDATFNAVACVQYAGKMYFLNQAGGAGISRTLAEYIPGGAFTILNPANLNTMIPGFGGGALCVFKERLWIVPGKNATANTSRLVCSDIGAPGTYSTTTQFIDIRTGDGENLVDICVFADNIMLFKEHSTFALTYSTLVTNGQVTEINNKIGTSSQRCMVVFEGSIYVFHTGYVYVLDSNFAYTRINVQCPFVYDATTPSVRSENVFLSLYGERLFLRYFNRVYLYSLRTRTWTRWESASSELHNVGYVVRVPSDVESAALESYYAGSCLTASKKVFVMKDGVDETTVENDGTNQTISCWMQTKNYDLNASTHFKKLYWWSGDIVSTNSVTGTASVVSYNFITTWGTLYNNGTTVLDLSTWSSPMTTSTFVTTVTPAVEDRDQFAVRFAKVLRFRRINFKVELTTDGSTADGPCKVLDLTILVQPKANISLSIS